MKLSVAVAALLTTPINSSCPYLSSLEGDAINDRQLRLKPESHPRTTHEVADFASVQKDLKELFQTSDPKWPSDYNHYGP